MPLRDIILLSFFVVSLPVCFVRPLYGVLLWAVVSFLNPQSYIWGGASFFPWALAVAIPTIAGALVFSRGWSRRLASREVLLILALWIWFSVTSVVSTNTPLFLHHAADTWYRWGFVSKIMLMTMVTIAIVDGFEQLRKLVLVIAGSFGFYVLKALPFMIMTRGGDRVYGPAQSMISDNNDFGLALNMTLPLFLFLAQTESRRWVRRLSGFLFVITIPAILFTYSRGALVGLVAVLAVILLQFKQRLLLMPVLVLAAIIALVFAPESWKERMDPTSSSMLDSSAQGRLNAWSFSWRLASDYPITGGGFETFSAELFDRYAPKTRDWHGPHSVYFQILAEHGFVGIFLYLMLVGSCFLSARRLMKLGRAHGDEVIVNYAKMFRLSLIGFLVSGLFLGRAYFDYFFTIVACMAILKQAYFTELRETDPLELEAEKLVLA